MTKEEQKLLLQDLCEMLIYGVKTSNGHGVLKLSPRTDVIYVVDNGHIPYLRPMSSMTEEEKQQIRDFWIDADTKEFAIRLLDFYNQNHLDYRGLIPMGLAIRVTKENNPYKD